MSEKVAVTKPAVTSKTAVTKPVAAPKVKKNTLGSFALAGALDAKPENYDFTKFKALKKNDFKKLCDYFKHRADEMLHKSAMFLKDAENAGKFGSGKELQAARRLVKMTEKLAALQAQLKASGVDVDALMKASVK